MALIEISHLSFTYEGSFEPVFEDLSLQLDTDWRLGLIGRNGRGKTTLLRLLLGEGRYTGTISAPEPFDYFPFNVPDLEAMRYVGMPVCPADAAPEVVEASRYVSQFRGGEGCVRDVIEQVMRARGDWYKEGDEPIRVASR